MPPIAKACYVLRFAVSSSHLVVLLQREWLLLVLPWSWGVNCAKEAESGNLLTKAGPLTSTSAAAASLTSLQQGGVGGVSYKYRVDGKCRRHAEKPSFSPGSCGQPTEESVTNMLVMHCNSVSSPPTLF